MPQDPAAAVSALLRGVSIDDHEEVLKAANAAIKADKTDVTAQHTRVVALLHLDRFDDALRAIAEGGVKLEASCVPEKAYALYKTGKLDEASETLRAVGLEKKSYNHIAAQVAYRAERFDEAYDIYQRILETDPADEEHDMMINIRAVVAQAEWYGSKPSGATPEQHLDTFELCYNAACSFISRGAFDKAHTLLRRAATLCDGSDDLTEEDKHAEMQPILAQTAYVLSRLGKTKEALDLYNKLGQSGDNDADLSLVIDNNRAALDDAPVNPYLLQRRAASWTSRGDSVKLFKNQADLLNRNILIVDWKANKVRGVSDRTAKALSSIKHPVIQPGINALSELHAVAAAHGTSGKEFLRALQDLAKKRPEEVGLILTIVQTHLRLGNPVAALSALETFLEKLEAIEDVEAKDVRFSPGLVALKVSLMRDQGRQGAAKTELARAARYWQDRPISSSGSLLQEAGIELLRSPNPNDLKLAGSAFERLFSESQGSHIAAAGLVASLAPFDLEKAEAYVGELPEVDQLIEDVDVDALIDAGVAVAPKSAAAAAAAKRSAPADDADRKQPAKKRRTRKLPKNYEEGKTPDPERWLPLRDRSSYRPKGKKGKKKAAESTQGGMVREEETLGLVGGGGVKVEKAASGGGSSSNKKKKKGKK